MTLEMRQVTPDEFERWVSAEAEAYGNQLPDDPAGMRAFYDLDRSIAVFDGGKIVGGAYSYEFEMAVPGGSAATAGVADVVVQATHRRQGILTRMMDHQLKDVHERGEPLAALHASESVIYGRFGYGTASFGERWIIERGQSAYARPYELQGRVSFIDPADMVKVFPDVFRQATMGTPGVVQRPTLRWEEIARDPEHWRRGGGPLFHAIYKHNGSVDGYVSYRVKERVLTVHELMAVTTEARAALWRFCFDMDIMRSTEAYARPVDDPLPWMLADPRRLERTVGDNIWLRLVDVRAALAARRYMQSDRLVIEVPDEFCPWNEGRYELEGGPEGAECRASTSSPDLALSVADLAAGYLGSVRFTTLARAGRVDERTPGALERADAMFSSARQPWTPFTW